MSESNSHDVDTSAEKKLQNKAKISTEEFYQTAENYWNTQPATVNGMLGGYERISDTDISQSQNFLSYLLQHNKIEKKMALDCGAGIGRITKNLLLKNFDQVEMCDVSENFIKAAKDYLGTEDSTRITKFHTSGLQKFYPEIGKYDVIWIQWVIGYLKDNDLVEFLKRCKLALKPNGICVLKENICVGDPELDEIDSSYTRSKKTYMNLIHKAGMHVIKDEKQKKFPDELYEVRMFAFK